MTALPTLRFPDSGVPLYWRNEQTGVMAAAVTAYLNHRPLTESQIDLLRVYCEHWANCPCWDAAANGDTDGELRLLRMRAKLIRNADELGQWLHDAVKLGIDPL